MIKNEYWSSWKVRLVLSDFNETWFFKQIFEKYSNIKFHENPSSDIRGVPCWQTDRKLGRWAERRDGANTYC